LCPGLEISVRFIGIGTDAFHHGPFDIIGFPISTHYFNDDDNNNNNNNNPIGYKD
jgi:hypothetical protein